MSKTTRDLRKSGWFYEGITSQQSNELLKNSSVGTFLVRNSSDPNYVFTLCAQTERGPISVRLIYFHGYFRLNAQKHIQHEMPIFPGVIELIRYYMEQTKYHKTNKQVWVDPLGQYSSSILLVKPLKKTEPPSLKHVIQAGIHKMLVKICSKVVQKTKLRQKNITSFSL